MKKLIFAIPLLVLINLNIFSYVAEFIRNKSDVSVLAGVTLLCLAIASNYFLLKYIIKHVKTKTK